MKEITIQVAKLLTLAIFLQNFHCGNVVSQKSVSTSIVGMETLLELERQLLTLMESYANELENKLKVVRSAYTEMHTKYLRSQINPEKFLFNPLNIYALIRSLHDNWENWNAYLRQPIGEVAINKIESLRVDFPTSVDMEEASNAILYLNVIYDISPAAMATGLLKGRQYDVHFTSVDAFSIGYHLLQRGIYDVAEMWLDVSLQLYKESYTNAVIYFEKIKILQLYAEVLLKQNRSVEALNALNNALQLNPHKVELLHKKSEIESRMSISITTSAETEWLKEEGEENLYEKENEKNAIKQMYIFKTHCRNYPHQSGHHCLYNRITSAFLQLAHLKMEILSLDPYVILYHDVISDEEIAAFKGMAGKELQRAVIFDGETYKQVVDESRTVKARWLDILSSTDVNILKRLHRRISDMSGFDLWDSESIQIMNYGMGGYFRTHYDFLSNSQLPSHIQYEEGDRIATVLFYLSDVEQGGATVFPLLNIRVFPKKGSALLWHNLNSRGEVDRRTEHGACPVIVGSKWIFTKWIAEYSQMFRRPCYV